MAAGGQPMALPTADEVRLAVYNLTTAPDLYDDVENTYRHLPDGTRRDKCREWGLQYDDDLAEEGSNSSSSSSRTPP